MPSSSALTSKTDRTHRPSRARESVLDEDTYTETLSHIIARDFFPQLPHLHATNAYLSALSSRDPEQLSMSIRRLAALSREAERGGRSTMADVSREREEHDLRGTPRSSYPERHRTPIGARYFDTPDVRVRSLSPPDDQDRAGPSRRPKRRRPAASARATDLSLNDFSRVYTSEDNASFADILEDENIRNREKWSWAWDAEKKAIESRLKLEARRERLLIEAGGHTTSQSSAGLIMPASDVKSVQEGSGRSLITSELPTSSELVITTKGDPDNTVAIRSEGFTNDPSLEPDVLPSSPLRETHLDPSAPLTRALLAAGLPSTALVDASGHVVPVREAAGGAGDDRGRGEQERNRRRIIEDSVMDKAGQKDLRPNGIGAGAQGWGYKARNALMFPADADAPPNNELGSTHFLDPAESRQEPPRVVYANTALDDGTMDHRPGLYSATTSSPSRSRVGAAVSGNAYHQAPPDDLPSVNSYSLLPTDASPSPAEMPDLLTWGTLLATPRALGFTGDILDGSAPFRLPDTQRRDQIGRRLADNASRSMRIRAKGYAVPTSTPTASRRTEVSRTKTAMLPPATPRRHASSLTPAARRLLERSSKSTSTSSERPSKGESAQRTSSKERTWTPSPAHR